MDFIYIAAAVTAVTEVLKRLPKVPVNSGNAIYAVLVLVTIATLTTAFVNGSLTNTNVEQLVISIAATFGYAEGLYQFIQMVGGDLLKLIKK